MHDPLNYHFNYLGKDFEYYFGLMYSLYNVPNIFMPIIGGILAAKFGSHSMYLVFSILIVIGQFILCMGCSYNSMAIFLIGRTIYGLGSECISITQISILVKWFGRSELGLPTTIIISFGRLTGALNDITSPMLVEKVRNLIL